MQIEPRYANEPAGTGIYLFIGLSLPLITCRYYFPNKQTNKQTEEKFDQIWSIDFHVKKQWNARGHQLSVDRGVEFREQGSNIQINWNMQMNQALF